MNSSNNLPSAVFIVGTRAQLIKMAPVLVACENLGHPTILLMTGQHRETMQDLIEEFGIRSPQVVAVAASERSTVRSLLSWIPQACLGLNRELRGIQASGARLDVVVHGDTLSTLLGTVLGRRCGARVVHIESGLTSGRILNPFPEELIRRAVFGLADLALCPDMRSTDYMRRHYRCDVVNTCGNTIVDAVRIVASRLDFNTNDRGYVLASLHRFQNLYNPLRFGQLLDLMEEIASERQVRFVLHPATRKRLIARNQLSRLESIAGIQLLPRLGYSDFLQLASNASCVLTDGGSNQEELAVLGVPTVVMRPNTERVDGLGKNATMEGDIAEGVPAWILDGGYRRLRKEHDCLGGGSPSMRIARLLAEKDSPPADTS